MAFNWDLRVPYKYGNQYVTLRQLERFMVLDYHPEYVRRFIGWLHYKNGYVGAGGLSRTEQPTGPTFAASLLVSFHWAGQKYNDGITGACAVDTLVQDGPDPGDAHDSIPWREVPIQGSAEAVKWGLHANVGSPTGVGLNESWHIQPIEIDGHASWVKAGRPAPVRNYPIPAEHDPYGTTTQPEPPAPSGGPEMIALDHKPGTPEWTAMLWTGVELSHVFNGNADAVLRRAGVERQTVNDAELDGIIASSTTKTAAPSTFTGERATSWNSRRG